MIQIDEKQLAKDLKQAADYLAEHKESGGCYHFHTVELDEKDNSVTDIKDDMEEYLYINQDFAAGIAMYHDAVGTNALGSTDNGLQVRTLAQLDAVQEVQPKLEYVNKGTIAEKDITDKLYIRQTYNIGVNTGYKPIALLENYVYDGGAAAGHEINVFHGGVPPS